MRVWSYSLDEVLRWVDPDQYRFLGAVQDPSSYLAILIVLFRARGEGAEVPFEELLDRVGPQLRARGRLGYDGAALREDLAYLERNRNVRQRIEPKRLRRLQDHGLERYLVRLTEESLWLMEELEQRVQRAQGRRTSSARNFLRDVESDLDITLGIITGESSDPEELQRAGHSLERAQAAAEGAARDLLDLELWLGETALEAPEASRLERLVRVMEGYIQRYLDDLEHRRQRCVERLDRLEGSVTAARWAEVNAAVEEEFEEDPLRRGRAITAPLDSLNGLRAFFAPAGSLDVRRRRVHERLTDVLGHLERHLAAAVRRSQLRAQLRERITELASAPDLEDLDVDRFFLNLWKPAHLVIDGSEGSPRSKAPPPRPRRRHETRRPAFTGTRLRSTRSSEAEGRPLLQRQLEDLDRFVERAVLRGREEAPLGDAQLASFADVQLLMQAIRFGLLGREFHRQLLSWHILAGALGTESSITVSSGEGRFVVPAMIFRRGHERDG